MPYKYFSIIVLSFFNHKILVSSPARLASLDVIIFFRFFLFSQAQSSQPTLIDHNKIQDLLTTESISVRNILSNRPVRYSHFSQAD